MTRRLLPHRLIALLLAGLFAVCSSALAQQQDPAELVRDTFDRSMAALTEHQDEIREDPRVAYRLIEEILAPRVDFELMSRLILARHWAEATPEQREQFVAVFRESLLRTYSKLLSDNVDEAVRQARRDRQMLRVLPTGAPDRRGRVNVRTLVRVEGNSIPMDYRMYQSDGEWMVFDVLIENISFVMNYRSEYDAELQRGELDALIERIAERNRRAWTEPAETPFTTAND